MSSLEFYEAQREELVWDKTKLLISRDGELYPFTPAHINEALMEMKDKQMDEISELCSEGFFSKFYPQGKIMEMLGRSICCNIYEYWENMAQEQAERETPSAHELHQQELEFQHDMSKHNSA